MKAQKIVTYVITGVFLLGQILNQSQGVRANEMKGGIDYPVSERTLSLTQDEMTVNDDYEDGK